MEGQEDYDEDSFEFSERENRASNNTPDIAKLSEMEYYSSYGKGAARYNTAWILFKSPHVENKGQPIEKEGMFLFIAV